MLMLHMLGGSEGRIGDRDTAASQQFSHKMNEKLIFRIITAGHLAGPDRSEQNIYFNRYYI